MREEFLQPLCAGWVGKIRHAIDGKKEFKAVSDQCMQFYSGATDFMWATDFFKRYIGGRLSPRFKITIAKAFELVSIFGPVMYWRNPARIVKPRKPLELPPELADVFQDPMTQQLMLMYQEEQAQRGVLDKTRAELLSMWLNYTPTEQPGGGLALHSQQAITEALVKGRGCLWPKPYYQPGSQRVLTGCFFDSVDNLLIDPDAESLHHAKWIARRRFRPIWEVEKEFGLPKDILKERGGYESAWMHGDQEANRSAEIDRQTGKTFDMIEYWEIYSKAGVGGRLSGQSSMGTELNDAFDKVVGDYAYIVVAPNVPFPLNAYSNKVRRATDAEVQKMFQWPIPFWLDDRWPVSVLDFYYKPNSAWPIAPLSPGIGELTFLNVMFSALANRIWQTSRTFVGINAGNIDQDIENQLRSGEDLAMLKISRAAGKLTENVDFLRYPETNLDVFKIIDYVMALFDRRVGLTELIYGLNAGGTQSRTAEDSANKREMASVRPEYMAGKVEDWQTEVADMEKLCARWFVKGQDLQGLAGQSEQFLWENLIVNVDPEMVVREMKATVMANSVRRPDKRRDVENINQVLPQMFPALLQYGMGTGQMGPINTLIQHWGKAIDQDMKGMYFQPPQPNPEQEAAQQAEQQKLELEKLSAELDMQIKQSQHQQSSEHKEEQHEQKLEHKEEQHELAMDSKEEMAEVQAAAQRLLARTRATTMRSSGQGSPSSNGKK